jgi:hypothetical protein
VPDLYKQFIEFHITDGQSTQCALKIDAIREIWWAFANLCLGKQSQELPTWPIDPLGTRLVCLNCRNLWPKEVD